MSDKKPCFHFVTSLFVNNNGEQIFYEYKWVCTRPWKGLNFAPTLSEIKQYFLDKDYRKVRKFLVSYRLKKNTPKRNFRKTKRRSLHQQINAY